MARESFVDEKLKSFARVNKIAEYALDKAAELGLTQQETEEIPEQIKQILKWERCRDNIEYKRLMRPDDIRARCLKVLW